MRQILLWFAVILLVVSLGPGRALSDPIGLSIEINREGRFLELEEVIQILETGFRKLYPEKHYSIEIKAILHYEKISLPSGHLSCDMLLSNAARRGGNLSVSLVFRTKGIEVGKSKVNARVDITLPVLIAAHYLGKHQEVQAKDFEWGSRSLFLLPQDVVSDMKEVLGKRMTLAINKGEVLRRGMVEDPPLVKRGDRVRLLVENDQIKITTVGEIREEGRKGDRVKLVNLSSKKEVIGRVIDEHTVQIDF